MVLRLLCEWSSVQLGAGVTVLLFMIDSFYLLTRNGVGGRFPSSCRFRSSVSFCSSDLRTRSIRVTSSDLPASSIPGSATGIDGSILSRPIRCATSSSIAFRTNVNGTGLCKSDGIGCAGLRLRTSLVAVGVSDDVIRTMNHPSSANEVGGRPIFGRNSSRCRPRGVDCGFGAHGTFVSGMCAGRNSKFLVDRRSGHSTRKIVCMQRNGCAAYGTGRPRFCVTLAHTGIHPNGSIMFNPTCLIIRSIPLPLTVPCKFFPFDGGCSSNLVVPAFNSRDVQKFCLHSKNCCFTVGSVVSLGLVNRVCAGKS